VGSTKDQVQVSYDVSNEFFRLWLDERMNYTSAVFENDEQSLEAAQLNKLRILAEFAHVTPETKVLDIGCGWGANVEYLATARKVKNVYGITLSSAQMEEINQRKIPGVKAYCCDYKDHKPEVKYDAVESICMIDHLVSPEEARQGKAVDNLRKYFKTVHSWRPPAHRAQSRPAHQKGPRGRALGHPRHFPGRAQSAHRGSGPGRQSLLGDHGNALAPHALPAHDPRVAQAPPRSRRRDPAEVG
jgi:hypothetical protein